MLELLLVVLLVFLLVAPLVQAAEQLTAAGGGVGVRGDAAATLLEATATGRLLID